jgi:hypothetical protein
MDELVRQGKHREILPQARWARVSHGSLDQYHAFWNSCCKFTNSKADSRARARQNTRVFDFTSEQSIK